MNAMSLPYQPIRGSLYSDKELFAGFDPGRPASFAETTDFKIYEQFIVSDGAHPDDALASMMRSLHDNTITQAMSGYLESKRCVAVMGGHGMSRSSSEYRQVADLVRGLTIDGFVAASGGGPGAMEATHLGARLSRRSPDEFDMALKKLSAVPDLPDLRQIVDHNGNVNAGLVAQAFQWFLPAYQVATDGQDAQESLAVPTWHYGHEPATPLATHIGKYFENSIREDGLLAIATHGVVYVQGAAGTLQEIFQDAAQNYYHSFENCFSPMVFLGVDFWEKKLPVKPLLESLFSDVNRKKEFEACVLFTDDIKQARSFIANFKLPTKITSGLVSLTASPVIRRFRTADRR